MCKVKLQRYKVLFCPEYTPDFLIPNNYHYEKELFSPLSPESFLYLLGGGSIHTDSPLAFRFPSMDCHLLLLTTMGSGRITTPGGSEGRGKKKYCLPRIFPSMK